MTTMTTGQTDNPNMEPLSDLAYDWVTIIQHKSEALRAYQEYMRDAKSANSPECESLMRQIFEDDARHVQEATQHLMKVLQGGMGRVQGQVGGRNVQSSRRSDTTGDL